MAKDHTAGINALPKWDPSNPTRYVYDPLNYDRADYAQFKAARLAAHPLLTTGNPFGPNGSLAAAAPKQHASQALKDATLKAAKAAPKNAVLHWDGASTCFESISYSKKTGILHCVFLKRDDGSGWDYDVDLEDAINIMMDDSPGGFFNAEIRE